MNMITKILAVKILLICAVVCHGSPDEADKLQSYVKKFNGLDHTHFGQAVSNEEAADWMAGNVPLFDCPDKEIEEIYYFRWWTFRKHISKTPDGFVITEFLPKVSWSGKHNTISCAAGHHFREGRWIRDPKYLDDYAGFWFRKGGAPRRYSFWAADSIYRGLSCSAISTQAAGPAARSCRQLRGVGEIAARRPTGSSGRSTTATAWRSSVGGSGKPRDDQHLHVWRRTAPSRPSPTRPASRKSRRPTGRRRSASERLVLDKAVGRRGEVLQNAGPRGQAGCGRPRAAWLHAVVLRPAGPGEGLRVAWKQLMDPQGFYAPFGPRPPSSGIPVSRFPTTVTSVNGTARAGRTPRRSP